MPAANAKTSSRTKGRNRLWNNWHFFQVSQGKESALPETHTSSLISVVLLSLYCPGLILKGAKKQALKLPRIHRGLVLPPDLSTATAFHPFLLDFVSHSLKLKLNLLRYLWAPQRSPLPPPQHITVIIHNLCPCIFFLFASHQVYQTILHSFRLPIRINLFSALIVFREGSARFESPTRYLLRWFWRMREALSTKRCYFSVLLECGSNLRNAENLVLKPFLITCKSIIWYRSNNCFCSFRCVVCQFYVDGKSLFLRFYISPTCNSFWKSFRLLLPFLFLFLIRFCLTFYCSLWRSIVDFHFH